MSVKAITIHPSDNLGIALSDLNKGERVTIGEHVTELKHNIEAKHKFALDDFEAGTELFMYGLVVGTAQEKITRGEAITTNNVSHRATGYDIDKQAHTSWTPPSISNFSRKTFKGYHRKDGQVGTDNIWLVFPLVFCENRNIEVMKKAFEKALGYDESDPNELMVDTLVSRYGNGSFSQADVEEVTLKTITSNPKKPVFENVKVRFITHQGGCGGIRQDAETLCKLLAGYIK